MPAPAKRPIELAVGLGNPGAEYAQTRHNAGFWFLDALASRLGATLRPHPKFFGEVGEGSIGGHRVRLLKPTTFMNRSGQAVAAIAAFYRIPTDRVLIVHDEIDLPLGTVRLKDGGGHGGHNGLRDIIAHLKGNGFARLRIGVGHPGQRDDVIGHVLRRPGSDERARLAECLDRAMGPVEVALKGDLNRAMSSLNRRRPEGEGADDEGSKET